MKYYFSIKKVGTIKYILNMSYIELTFVFKQQIKTRRQQDQP